MTLKIGNFTLSLLQFEGLPEIPDQVWIQKESGEAGAFDLKPLEQLISDFYEENF